MIAALHHIATGILAADVDPVTGRDPEWGKAAPAGLLIWIFLGAALFLLVKSMNRHMRRVPKSFDTGEETAPESTGTPDDGPDGISAAARIDSAEAVGAEEEPEPSS